MADEKLSELPVITPPLQSSDQIYVVRAGVSYQTTVDEIPGGSAVWGAITGDIDDQTDLFTELQAKAVAGPLASPASGLTADGPILLGRYTGGVGSIEEIQPGNSLQLNAPGQLDVVLAWGEIVGTLADQDDLQTALDAKANVSDLSGYVKLDQSTPQTIGATGARLAKLWATDLTVTNAISGAVTGNAGSATVLATARNINGVSFNGSADITVTAAASTLTGTTLSSGVVTSSLTTVGALASGSLATGFVVGGVTMTLGSDAANDVYYRNSSGVLTRLANGTTGQFLAANTGAAPTWGTPAGAGTVTHTGNLTANAVVLGNGTADVLVVAGITTDGTSQINLGVASTTLGKLKLFGNTSGDVTLRPSAVAGTATVLTLPASTDTLVGLATTDTLTNKTLTSPAISSGAFSGTNVFQSTSLKVVGTGNGFNAGIQVDDSVWGSAHNITFTPISNANAFVSFPAGTFMIARSDGTNTFTGVQTMTSPDLTTPLIKGATSSGSTSIDFSGNSGTFKTTTGATTLGSTATVNGYDVRNPITPTTHNANYTTVLADGGLALYHDSGSAHTWTIDSNANVPYPVGTTLTFLNLGSGAVTIAITTDTMYWLPTGATGSRTLALNGQATAFKYASGGASAWTITGVGLT